MASYAEIFQRVEQKYRLTQEQRAAMAQPIESRMNPGDFPRGTVTSLYLDTSNRSLIARSLEKPLYKEKLRVRYYGPPEALRDDSTTFVELKKKFRGIVYKRRLCMSWTAARKFLGGMPYEAACLESPLAGEQLAAESLSARSVQISGEIRAFEAHHGGLSFSTSISCERTAFQGGGAFDKGHSLFHTQGTCSPACRFDDGLRLTFDEDIRYAEVSPEGRIGRQKHLLSPAECLMEIKSSGGIPLWLCRSLSQEGICPTSFSKYGESFKAGISGREPLGPRDEMTTS